MQSLRTGSDPRQIMEVVNNIVKQFDNYGFFTLRHHQTETHIVNGKINSGSLVLISPQDENSAAEYASGSTYVSATIDNQFTVTHESNTKDRKFGYVIFGV